MEAVIVLPFAGALADNEHPAEGLLPPVQPSRFFSGRLKNSFLPPNTGFGNWRRGEVCFTERGFLALKDFFQTQ